MRQQLAINVKECVELVSKIDPNSKIKWIQKDLLAQKESSAW